MLIVSIVLLLLIVALYSLFLFGKQITVEEGVRLDNLKKPVRERIKEDLMEAKRMAAEKLASKKPAIKGIKGEIMETIIEVSVIGSFFHKDVKFAAIVPKIDSKLVNLPGVVELTKDGDVIWESKHINEDVYKKVSVAYKKFRKENPDAFYKGETDGE